MKKGKVKKLIKRIESGIIILKSGGVIAIDNIIDIRFNKYRIIIDKMNYITYTVIGKVKVYKYKTKNARKANGDNDSK